MKAHNNHPPSLRVFVVTEMWERYGFYVVQTLLALFLALHFKWPDKKVYFLVSSFTALNYLTPLIGGWVADYLIGQKRAIILGAILLFISYIALAYMNTDVGLTLVLAAIPVGTGLLKPNISSLLGNEYPEASPKRDAGFTIFYMGLATGIILGTTLPSIINAHYGWAVSFASASLGMLLALVVFLSGIKRCQIKDYHPSDLNWSKLLQALGICLLLWLGSYYVLDCPKLANLLIISIVILSGVYFVYSIRRESVEQSRKTFVIALLCMISVLFWAFYFQMFMSLTLFVVRVVKSELFGFHFYPPYYISIQSIGLILFGFYFSSQKKHLTISESGKLSADKFLIAVIGIMIAYASIAFICKVSGGASLLSPLLFIPVYLIFSLSEILLSPVGLSAVSLLANTKKVSTMVGMFFVTLGVGAFLSGKLADLAAIDQTTESIELLKSHYGHAFMIQSYILLAGTVVCVGLNRHIKRLLS